MTTLTTTPSTTSSQERAGGIVLMERSANGTARLLRTILVEKTTAAPRKLRYLATVARRVACIHATDRDERAYLEWQYEDVLVRGVAGMPPRVTVVCESSWIPKVLSLREGPLGLPKLWDAPGRKVVGALVRRRIVVRGLLLHPVTAIRLLQVLSVPRGR